MNIESRGQSHSKYITIERRERLRDRGEVVVCGRSLRYLWQEFSLQDSRATSWGQVDDTLNGDLYVP